MLVDDRRMRQKNKRQKNKKHISVRLYDRRLGWRVGIPHVWICECVCVCEQTSEWMSVPVCVRVHVLFWFSLHVIAGFTRLMSTLHYKPRGGECQNQPIGCLLQSLNLTHVGSFTAVSCQSLAFTHSAESAASRLPLRSQQTLFVFISFFYSLLLQCIS